MSSFYSQMGSDLGAFDRVNGMQIGQIEPPSMDVDGMKGALEQVAKEDSAAIKPDDTWFTPDRMKAIQKAADQNEANQKNNQTQDNMMSAMKFAEPKLTPAQLVPMQPMQLTTRVGRVRPPAYAQGGMMQGIHGEIRLPAMGHGKSGGMKVGFSHPNAKMKFANGGAFGLTQPSPQQIALMHDQRGYADGGAFDASSVPGFAGGGMMEPLMLKTMMEIRDGLNKTPPQNQGALQTGMQKGPGTALSDSIHGQLANGGKVATGKDEYVMPGDVVSFWGGHSSDAGGKAMDAFVDMTRKLDRHESKTRPRPR